MCKGSYRAFVSLVVFLSLAAGVAASALAQESPYFLPGNLVVVVEGCGVYGGTCTNIPNGTGTAAGYGDNQAGPLTLFQYTPTGTTSVTYLNSLVLPQSPSGANVQVSGELGSSSEGTVQLSGDGKYLTLMGYGIDALSFNANPDNYGTLLNGKGSGDYTALGQTGSFTPANQISSGQTSLSGGIGATPAVACTSGDNPAACYPSGYTPVPRVLALIDADGNVNTATALYNIFDFNNPRSAYTADGSSFYASGQGTGCDATGGVFYSATGAVNNSPTAITGNDAAATTSCNAATGLTTVAQDTRTVQIYNGTLYVSADSTEGKSDNRSFIGTLGNPPATSLFTPPTQLSGYSTGQAQVSGLGNSGGTGKTTLTTGGSSNGTIINTGASPVVTKINLSPSGYFFASPTVLYVADLGNPKNDSDNDTSDSNNFCGSTSANSGTNTGDGGLQKWVNNSGTWSLAYTLYKGLNLVSNCGASGTTGLYGLTGTVVSGVAHLYATNATIGDEDPTYLYGITDTLTTTTNPGTTFALLDTAPADSNFKGVSFTPSIPNGDVEVTSSPSGLAFTSSGTGCAPSTYTTPVTLTWTPDSSCQLSVVSPQTVSGTQYVFSQWQDGTTATTDSVTAPTTSAVYNATFQAAPLNVTSSVSITSSALSYNRATHIGTATMTVKNIGGTTLGGPLQLLLAISNPAVTAANATGTYLGNPYWNSAGSLAPGASVSFTVTFNYTLGTTFTTAPNFYSGGL